MPPENTTDAANTYYVTDTGVNTYYVTNTGNAVHTYYVTNTGSDINYTQAQPAYTNITTTGMYPIHISNITTNIPEPFTIEMPHELYEQLRRSIDEYELHIDLAEQEEAEQEVEYAPATSEELFEFLGFEDGDDKA